MRKEITITAELRDSRGKNEAAVCVSAARSPPWCMALASTRWRWR